MSYADELDAGGIELAALTRNVVAFLMSRERKSGETEVSPQFADTPGGNASEERIGLELSATAAGLGLGFAAVAFTPGLGGRGVTELIMPHRLLAAAAEAGAR